MARKKAKSRTSSTARKTTRKAGVKRSTLRSKSKVTEKPFEELSIAVTFRQGVNAPGIVAMGGYLNAETRKAFEPDERAVRKAMQVLQANGFRLSSRGRYSVVVRGDRKSYEKLFGTKLSTMKMQKDIAPGVSARSLYFPGPGAPWSPDPGVIPLIDEAYIQWPHIFMNQRFAFPPSAVPPQVDYHHLRVPGDVSMLLGAAKAHRQGITGRGVRVAMIDSGFNHSLPWFQEMGYNSSVVLAPGASHVNADLNGHGTGESANLFAVAPDIQFIGIKTDNDEGGPGASILEGFQEALRQNPQVISVSLGYDLANRPVGGTHFTTLPNSLRALEAEIQAAIEDGIVVVFSAGNGHVAFPGMMPDLISAGGVFVDSNGAMLASDYASAFTSKIYPGRSVPDCCGLVGMAANNADYIMLPIQPECKIDKGNAAHDGTSKSDGWGVFSGTSAAAPQLAGACALLLQKDPSLSPSDLIAILRRTSRDVVNGSANAASNVGVPIAAGPGSDSATGTGLIDTFAALQQV